MSSGIAAARSSTPGGRPRPAAFSSRRCPGATRLKPGSATRPFFGVIPEIVDAAGNVQEGACEGNLVIADSWPGQSRTVFGDHARFVNTYFAAYPGKYFTGDGARRDADG